VKRDLVRTSTFVRSVRKFLKKDPHAVEELQNTLTALSDDAFAPRLKTHKLKGDLSGIWACSAGYDLRVLFEFVHHDGREAILLLTLGSHDEVY
jgi:addiction module RelE/StbE family toxin